MNSGKPLRVVVAGLGNMGRSHALAYHANPGFEIAALVSRRRRELALRMALGARSARLTRRVIARALASTVAGVALGMPAALVVANRLDVFRPESLPPLHTTALATATMVLVGVAAIAAWLPARAAGRVDPTELLRSE